MRWKDRELLMMTDGMKLMMVEEIGIYKKE